MQEYCKKSQIKFLQYSLPEEKPLLTPGILTYTFYHKGNADLISSAPPFMELHIGFTTVSILKL